MTSSPKKTTIETNATGSSIAERLAVDDGFPKIWDPISNPEAPNPLVAEMLSYDTVTTEFGDRLLAIMREEDTGTVWSRMVAGAVLEGEFACRKPLPGEIMRLEYRGQRTAQSGRYEGRQYHLWSLAIRRPPQVPNWSALAEGEVKLTDAEAEQPAAVVEPEVPIDAVLEESTSITEPAQEDDVPF